MPLSICFSIDACSCSNLYSLRCNRLFHLGFYSSRIFSANSSSCWKSILILPAERHWIGRVCTFRSILSANLVSQDVDMADNLVCVQVNWYCFLGELYRNCSSFDSMICHSLHAREYRGHFDAEVHCLISCWKMSKMTCSCYDAPTADNWWFLIKPLGFWRGFVASWLCCFSGPYASPLCWRNHDQLSFILCVHGSSWNWSSTFSDL